MAAGKQKATAVPHAPPPAAATLETQSKKSNKKKRAAAKARRDEVDALAPSDTLDFRTLPAPDEGLAEAIAAVLEAPRAAANGGANHLGAAGADATAAAQTELLATANELYQRMDAGGGGLRPDGAYWAALPAHIRNFVRTASFSLLLRAANDNERAKAQSMYAIAQQMVQTGEQDEGQVPGQAVVAGDASEREVTAAAGGMVAGWQGDMSLPVDPSFFADAAFTAALEQHGDESRRTGVGVGVAEVMKGEGSEGEGNEEGTFSLTSPPHSPDQTASKVEVLSDAVLEKIKLIKTRCSFVGEAMDTLLDSGVLSPLGDDPMDLDLPPSDSVPSESDFSRVSADQDSNVDAEPTPSDFSVVNASHLGPIRPPERLHPTLSCWLKNMKKLSSLIDRLQELASAAPPDLKPQLHKQVASLRSSFKKQQERCVEFLRLTEEYANRYLLDISAEIEQQRSFLDMLEKRLDMANTLHSQAMDLRKSYESGTVDAMKVVRKAALQQSIPADFDLFREVDFVLNAIRRCYMELDKFWTEEIRRAAKALKTRRVDPDDAKRWRDFKASLEQTIKSWKGTDLGAIASALSPALAKLEETLQRVRTSSSITPSPKNVALALRVDYGSRRNEESCLTFIRDCIHFAEKIAAYSAAFIPQPTFSRLRASNDLQERVVALGTEAVGVSTESATQFPGSRRFNSVYKQCLFLQQGTTHELNTLLENVSSWIVFVDGLPNVSLGGIRFGLLYDLVDAWEKGRVSIRRMLADLTDDPAERSRCQALSQTLPRPRSLITRLFSVARSSVKCRP